MRYTKYAYNQNKKSGFFIYLIIVVILGSFLGGLLFKLLFKSTSVLINCKSRTQNNYAKSVKDEYKKEFVAVQCGVFKNFENAKSLSSDIANVSSSFIVKENNQYKVITGIYINSQDANRINKELISKNVEGYCMKFNLSKNDDNLEYEIIKGYIKILNKVSEKNVQSVNTEDFKKWVSNNTKQCSEKEIVQLVNNINQLPSNINKDGNNERLAYLYKFLLKHKK